MAKVYFCLFCSTEHFDIERVGGEREIEKERSEEAAKLMCGSHR